MSQTSTGTSMKSSKSSQTPSLTSQSSDESGGLFSSSSSAFTRYQPLTNLQRGNVVQSKFPDEVALAERTIHSLAAQGEIFSLPSSQASATRFNSSNSASNSLNSLETESGLTPLHLASFHGHLSTVKLLLSSPEVDVSAVNERGQSALFYASFAGHAMIVRELLTDQRLDIDAVDGNENTALMFAAYCDRANVVSELLKHFPDLSIMNQFGETAYTIAVKRNNNLIVSIFDSHLLALMKGL